VIDDAVEPSKKDADAEAEAAEAAVDEVAAA